MPIYKNLNEQRLEKLEEEIFFSILEEGIFLENVDVKVNTDQGRPIKISYYSDTDANTSHGLRIKVKDSGTEYDFPINPSDGHLILKKQYMPDTKRDKTNDIITVVAGLASVSYKYAREYYGYKDKNGNHPANPNVEKALKNVTIDYFNLPKSERRKIQSNARSKIEIKKGR